MTKEELRRVKETMVAVLTPLLPYFNSETAIRVRKGLRLVCDLEAENIIDKAKAEEELIAKIESNIQETTPNCMNNRDFNAGLYIAMEIIKEYCEVEE